MPAAALKRGRSASLRKLWLNLHLGLALAVGFLFVLMGLTGSCNVFMDELDEIFNPDLVVQAPGHEVLSLDDLLAAVRKAHPRLDCPWSLMMPRHASAMLTASCSIPKEQTGGEPKELMVAVNPYTGEIVKSRYSGETLMTWIWKLHLTLMLGRAGATVVGFVGMAMLVSVLTGIYLWWPSRSRLVRALTLKRRASPERRVFDLHKVFGVYGTPVLAIVAFSGVYLVFFDYVRPMVDRFSPVELDGWADPQGLTSKIAAGAMPIPLASAVRSAEAVFPEARLRRIRMPEGPAGVYGIRLWQPGEANHLWPSTAVYVDQYSGEVIAVRDPNRFSAGETFLNVMYPLHGGEALGLPGRILVAIAGFTPLVLYVTGLVRWRQKRRAARRVDERIEKATAKEIAHG